jgi:hypothetical protein
VAPRPVEIFPFEQEGQVVGITGLAENTAGTLAAGLAKVERGIECGAPLW